LLTASTVESYGLRTRVTRYAAGWVLAGCLPIPLGGLWYISQIPPLAREISMGGAPAVTIFAGLSIALSAIIVLLTYFGPFRRPEETNVVLVASIAFLGLGVTGVTEWVREAVRKPYVIYGYMYSNGIRVADAPRVSERGVLASARWVSPGVSADEDWRRAGWEIFRIECRSCHTIDGYNGIRPMVKGWREDFIDYQLGHLSELKGFMPPFMGTTSERRALARWLADLGGRKPFSPPFLMAERAPAEGR
jgi:mono/diheme cytochrome c family protein